MIQNPPLDTVRAACAHLPGPCCFLLSCPLLPSLAPSPSCCCWPPLAFSLLVPVHTKVIMARNSVFMWWIFAVLVSCCLFLLFFGLFSCFVGVFCCCACCQPTEVTKDCRVLPAPSVNTHLATVTSSLPARIFWRLACP